MIIGDSDFLSRFKWRFTVVDEVCPGCALQLAATIKMQPFDFSCVCVSLQAHRLKNPASKLVTTLLDQFKLGYKLLLTGTPTQVRSVCSPASRFLNIAFDCGVLPCALL
jgi:hypothetical protein